MKSIEKMREEFEAAFVEEMVSRCGEGFRSSVRMFFVEKEPDGAYSNPIAHAGWWAWRASRAAIEVELPARKKPTSWQSYENHHNQMLDVFEKAIDAAGLKVKP